VGAEDGDDRDVGVGMGLFPGYEDDKEGERERDGEGDSGEWVVLDMLGDAGELFSFLSFFCCSALGFRPWFLVSRF
jgi:hypothetical protein